MNPGTAASRAATAKQIVGDTAKAGAAFRNALDDMGALVAWQKANPDLDYAEILAAHKAAGGTELDVLKTAESRVALENQLVIAYAIERGKKVILNTEAIGKAAFTVSK